MAAEKDRFYYSEKINVRLSGIFYEVVNLTIRSAVTGDK